MTIFQVQHPIYAFGYWSRPIHSSCLSSVVTLTPQTNSIRLVFGHNTSMSHTDRHTTRRKRRTVTTLLKCAHLKVLHSYVISHHPCRHVHDYSESNVLLYCLDDKRWMIKWETRATFNCTGVICTLWCIVLEQNAIQTVSVPAYKPAVLQNLPCKTQSQRNEGRMRWK